MSTSSILLVAAYILVIVAISLFSMKKTLNSYEEYSLCGRSLNIWYVFFTYLGTMIGGGTIIGLSGLSYMQGLSSYWMLGVPYLVGFPFAFLFITRIRKLQQYSIGDLFALRYPDHGEIIRIPVAVAVIIRNVTVVGMQFSAVSLLMVYLLNIDRNLALLFVFLVITTYTVLGGLWGVVLTDIIQGLLQTTGLAFLFYKSLQHSGGWLETSRYYQAIDETAFLSLLGETGLWNHFGFFLLTIGLYFLISDQGDWQRINSSKNDRVAFWGFIAPLCVSLIWLLIPAYVGVLHRVSLDSVTSYQYAIYVFILDRLTPAMGTFILLCLISAVMSSADSFLLATGLTFSRDIASRFINPQAENRELIFWSKMFTIIAGGMGFAFAISINDLVNLWIVGLTVSTAILLVPYLHTWFSKAMNTAGAFSGMLAGGTACFLWLLLGSPFGLHPIWVGAASNLLAATLVSRFTEKPAQARVMSTYYWSPRFSHIRNIP